MTRTSWVIVALAVAAPLAAQEPTPAPPAQVPAAEEQSAPATEPAAEPQARPQEIQAAAPPAELFEPFSIRRLDFGLLTTENDTGSSRFTEYRQFPGVGMMPFARFAGRRSFRYDVAAWNVLQDDARYRALIERGPVKVEGTFQRVPHRFAADARSPLQDVGNGTRALTDALQQAHQAEIERQFAANRAGVNFAFLNGMLAPTTAAQQPFDLKLQRDRGRIEMALKADAPVEMRLTYFQENRKGARGFGASFGFGNAVETAEPIDSRTRDLGLSVEWTEPWGLVRGGVHLNEFTNFVPVLTFDNPFRAVDATDASAYTAPGSGSIGGASTGRIALAPDNSAVTGSLGVLFKFGRRSRLTADASLGQWTQNEPFIPFTTNTAITVPFSASDVATLPTRSLDGRINVFSLASTFTSRPLSGLSLNARYRRYELSNETPRIEFTHGYTRFDAVWEEIPRVSVPYGYTSQQAQASVAWYVSDLTLEAGYRLDLMDRTYRETHETTQGTAFGSVNLRTGGWLVLRATAERGRRTFDEYDTGHSEHASYLEPGPPANLLSLRRFDQARKDTTRLVGQVQVSPVASTTLALSYVRGRDDYRELSHGLLETDNQAFSAELDFTPGERVSLFGFYSRETIASLQRGRQSGATLSINPLDDWTSDVDDVADTFGAGATLMVVPEALDVTLSGSYQKVDGNNDISAAAGGAPELARRAMGGIADIPLFDDTELLSLRAEVGYHLKSGWRVALGGLFEDYEIRDAATTGLANYVPGALFLAGYNGDYRAHVIYARLSYAW